MTNLYANIKSKLNEAPSEDGIRKFEDLIYMDGGKPETEYEKLALKSDKIKDQIRKRSLLGRLHYANNSDYKLKNKMDKIPVEERGSRWKEWQRISADTQNELIDEWVKTHPELAEKYAKSDSLKGIITHVNPDDVK